MKVDVSLVCSMQVPDAMIMQLVRESFRNDQQQFQVNMQTYRDEYDTYRLKFGMWQVKYHL